ncbi:MAG: glycosyltransferase [Clostridiales bacterium]|nr:glycosyltransferase [Clostridiales bacterium]
MLMLKKMFTRLKSDSTGIKKLNKRTLAGLRYTKYYKRLPLNDKSILLESQQGRTFNGNMYYLLRELITNPDYADYNIYYSVNEQSAENTIKHFKDKGYKNVTVVTIMTKHYYKLLASCKYLFTDTAFFPFFIKKEGQIYLNTWHGTPLKYLGKKSKSDSHSIGNVMRNFCFADYLLFPNRFTMEHIVEDYMLQNLSKAKILFTGYPRNTAFFNTRTRNTIRKYYEMGDKQIIAYLPTWRNNGSRFNNRIQYVYTAYHLMELDNLLTDKQVMYVNLHPIARDMMDYKMFRHIKKMPDDFETYEFLTAADCLITDYSSVMFDYALSGRKIILFTYDKEQYTADRGMYLDINEFPFPVVDSVFELVNEINRPKEYDDERFLKEFCGYDALDVCKRVCDTVILGKDDLIEIEEIQNNGKENVIIYSGNLGKNGITASLFNLGASLDMSERNYYVAYTTMHIKNNLDNYKNVAELFNYFPLTGKINLGPIKKLLYLLFLRRGLSAGIITKILDEELRMEIKRLFGGAMFSHAIQFNGYEVRRILLFSKFDCDTTIFVHSDMREEIKTRNNQRKNVLEYAYGTYDNVAVVSNGISHSVLSFNSKANVKVIENLIDYKKIEKKALLPVTFDDNTVSTVSLKKLNDILSNKSKVFVTVGRFSREKGHKRLIDAFERVHEKNNDTYLILIGGHGILYEDIKEYIIKKGYEECVFLIRSMSNPFAVIRRCDYLVLSSFYEGFGLVLAEGDICGLPVISTDIDGPRGFLKEHGGYIVENSTEGIYQGMLDLLDGKVPVMNVDYEKYNAKALSDFYELFQ